MAMLSFGGIDVSKDRLDVMIMPEERSSSTRPAQRQAPAAERLNGVRHGGEAFHVVEAVTSRRSPESFTAPGSATMRLTTVGGRCCSSAR
jgi:hypothetical protein